MAPTLVLPDGRRVDLDGDVVIGRTPIAPGSAPADATQHLAQVGTGAVPSDSSDQPGPSHGAPTYVQSAEDESAHSRSGAHTVGGIILLVWSAVGFANLRDRTPDSVFTAVDGRIIDCFTVPQRLTLEFFDIVSLPDTLSFLARGADIGPIHAIITAVLALVLVLVAPSPAVRWLLVALETIPMVLLVGILVTIGAESFDVLTDDIDRVVPWFVLPGIGASLLLLPGRRASSAGAPSPPVPYAPGQAPGPQSSSPPTPPHP